MKFPRLGAILLCSPTPMAKRNQPKTRTSLQYGVLAELVGFHLRRAQLAVYDDFSRHAPVKSLTPGQTAVLVFIDENPGITQQELCAGIQVEKSTLVVRLHRLEERGLIRRVRSTIDRRQNALELTPKGKANLRKMIAFIRTHERRVFGRLSPDERKQLIGSLQKIG